MLQAKAGYIDARPHIPHSESLLQRTVGPYIWVSRVGPTQLAASPDVRFTSNSVRISAGQRIDAKCQKRTHAVQQTTYLGCEGRRKRRGLSDL